MGVSRARAHARTRTRRVDGTTKRLRRRDATRRDVAAHARASAEGGREKDGRDEVGTKARGAVDADGGGILELFGGVAGGVRGDGARRGGERKRKNVWKV